ncbi:dicarboxylate/amino acid:cation symporter [Sporosarcina sp. G11-34]|uniref:dicarboxylate/amino acid:cation symporter n=1 Tax=Sporosarcina sp. G11-34 TaxID=2849605 RepID=UPI0022A8E9B7|nr:dicarboxylate/amino acid:cation symporter [Sporosarcina sp. G11-34]MCZ2257889.1 dicarboxylate/amino acid:cation symporter [Sporosarcina sp. G11-34]
MKLNLVTQIFIAFVLAIILGSIFGNSIDFLKPFGDLFLRLIKFIIAPLILSTLVVGVAGTSDTKQLGKMGVKTVAYYLGTTAVAIMIGLAVAYVMEPGKGLTISTEGLEAPQVAAEESQSAVTTILNLIPENPFTALAEGNILQIIFFALFIGIGITLVGEKAQPVYRFFEAFSEVMYKITAIIMKVAPIGVLGLLAPVVGEYGLTVLLPLLKIIMAVFIACILHAILVYSAAVRVWGKMNPLTFFKGISPAALVAFSTASSAGTLPMTIKNTNENLGVPNRVSSFVLPLGATINMDGTAIYQGVAVVFIAQFYGLDLTLSQLLMVVLTTVLASVGTAGVPGAGMIMLTMVLSSIGLPLEGIALIAGVDRILDMMRTCLNVIGDASAAVVVAGTEKKGQRKTAKKTAKATATA